MLNQLMHDSRPTGWKRNSVALRVGLKQPRSGFALLHCMSQVLALGCLNGMSAFTESFGG